MKKIATLTFHNCNNYGAVLQDYALQQKILEMGYETEIIDYSRNNIKDVAIMFKNKLFSILNGKPDKQLYSFKEFLELVFKGEGTGKDLVKPFHLFRKKYLLCSEPANRKNIVDLEKKYHRIIVGSDQVWNCGRVNIEPTYLLDFIEDDTKKASYAASFGLTEIPNKYQEIYRTLLSKFSYLSVREESAQILVRELIEKEAECVLDPTLLLTKKDWETIIPKKKKKETYILVYQLGKSENLFHIAEKLSKKTGIKVRSIKKSEDMGSNIRAYQGIGPTEWLILFLNADYIITNSFHGVAFSINFEKEFFAIRAEDTIRISMESRIESLLKKVDLEQRYISDDKQLKLEEKIDYLEVSKKLNLLREDSITFLKKILE